MVEVLKIRFQTDGSGRTRAEIVGVGQAMGQAGDRGERFNRVGEKIEGTLRNIAAAGGAVAASLATRELVQNIAEYERLNAVLKVFEGSQAAANKRFEELREFTSQTPFQLQEVVEGFTRLKARGLDPNIATLRDIGQIAAANGKTLEQAVEAVADAATGEAERLKEFGIQMRTEGEQVELTFGGVTKTIRRDAASIVTALREIGQENFAGSIEEQMDTLNGLISNTQDGIFNLSVALGELGFSDHFQGQLKDLIFVVNALTSATMALANAQNAGFGDDTVFGQARSFFDQLGGRTTGMLANPGGTALTLARQTFEQGTQRVQAIREEQEAQRDANETLSEFIALAREVSGRVGPAFAQAWADIEAQQAKANEKAEEYLAKIEQQRQEFGKSEAELIRLRAAQVAATTNNQELADAILAQADAVATQIEQQERSELAAKAEREEREHLKQLIEDEADAREEASQAMEDQNRRLQALIEKYNPAIKAQRQLNEEIAILKEALSDGDIGIDRFFELVDQAREGAFEGVFGPGESDSEDQVDAWVTAWERGVERLDDLFADLWKDFAENGTFSMDQLESFATNLTGEVLHQLVTKPLTESLQDYVTGIAQQQGGGENAGRNVGIGLGAGLAVGSLANGGQAGPWASGLGLVGGAIGTYYGGAWGAAIGSALGSVIGGAIDGDPDERHLSLQTRGQGGLGISQDSAFGGVQVNRADMVDDSQVRKIVTTLAEFDNAIAMLLGRIDPALIGEAAEALEQWNLAMEGEDLDAARAAMWRFRHAIQETLPEFNGYIANFEDPQKALAAFESLLDLQDLMEDIGTTIEGINATPAEQVALTVDKFNDKLAETDQALDAALETRDLERVADAAENAKQAVVDWLNAQVELARELEAELLRVQRSRRDFELGIAQRIAGVTGRSPDQRVLERQIPQLRDMVTMENDPEQALQHLDEFIGRVDQWLQASRDRVNRWLQEQLAALDAEEQDILDQGRARAQEEAERAQRAHGVFQQIRQLEIQALQDQLGLAREWARLSEQLHDQMEGLQLSEASPLTAFQRLELLNTRIQDAEATRAGASGEERLAATERLRELLGQRMDLLTSTDLLQAPSDDFVALYNDTVQRLEAMRADAEARGGEEDPLQAEIRALQQTNASGFGSVNSTNMILTTEEQERLEEIEAERQAAQDQAQAELESIDQQAADYYRWAREQGRDLHDQIEERVAAQLEELTGGLSVDEFIAQKQEEAVGYLENIDGRLEEFLDYLRNVIGGTGLPGEHNDPNEIPDDNDGGVGNPSIPGMMPGGPPPGGVPVPIGGGDGGTKPMPMSTKQGSLIGHMTIDARGANDPEAVGKAAEEAVHRAVAQLRLVGEGDMPGVLRRNAPIIGEMKKVG